MYFSIVFLTFNTTLDRLPVGEDGSLYYCHNNKDTNEMFAPLLEKAYAKLNSCYEFLDGGDTVDAIIDLSGGNSYNNYIL